ncbi:MAG: YegS/Rv2252/BmrU family lipid kinase, partial [Lachnospiraceae bacterium]|nr:YegS/Rv2252/BmrU family lipid kinase [Lachnospiraceae bacterium]
MDRKKALILINNSAGTGKGFDDVFDVVHLLAGKGYEPVLYPIVPGTKLTSEKLIEEYEGLTDMILCIGGDGTLNHVMNSVMNMKSSEKPIISYIPSGSTNDFAKCLGIPDTRTKAIRTAINGSPFSYDVGRLNEHYFNYVAAFGGFAEISYETDQNLKNVIGYAAYVINAIINLPKSIGYAHTVNINADGDSWSGEYVFGAVCNSISVGGMKLFENADVEFDDGLMELMLIQSPKNLSELNVILSALATGSIDNPYISHRQVKKVTISSESDISWTVDGENG